MPQVCERMLILPAACTAAAVASESQQESRAFSLGLHLILQMDQTHLGAGIAVHNSAVILADTLQQTSYHSFTFRHSSAARSVPFCLGG